jgi:cell division protein FtsB
MIYTRYVRSVFFALAFVYVSFHALHGGQGIIALLKENHKMEQLDKQLAETEAKRILLERRVGSMRTESLDKDMLEEQANRLLGMTQQGEILIIPE